MKINRTASHPCECSNCNGLIGTTDMRFTKDFGLVICFDCAQRERNPSFIARLLRWLK